MRRMFSKNQIEKLAKDVADYEIESLQLGEIPFLDEDHTYTGFPVFVDDSYLGILGCNDTDVGKVLGVNEQGEPALLNAVLKPSYNIEQIDQGSFLITCPKGYMISKFRFTDTLNNKQVFVDLQAFTVSDGDYGIDGYDFSNESRGEATITGCDASKVLIEFITFEIIIGDWEV